MCFARSSSPGVSTSLSSGGTGRLVWAVRVALRDLWWLILCDVGAAQAASRLAQKSRAILFMFMFAGDVLKKVYFGSIWRGDKGCVGIKNVKIAPSLLCFQAAFALHARGSLKIV